MLDNDLNIIWEGNSNTKFRSTLLSGGGAYLWYIGILVFFLLFSFIFLLISIKEGNYVLIIFFFLCFIFFLFLPDFLKMMRKKNTIYAYTNKSVIFILGKNKNLRHEVEFSDVKNIKLLRKTGSNIGSIIFYTNKKLNFKTYSFENDAPNVNPLFENIDYAEGVYLDLKILMQGKGSNDS